MVKQPQSPHTLYTTTYFIALTYNFLVALNFTNNAIYPLYVTHAGGSAAAVGLFTGAYSLAAVLGRPIIGPLIDRFGVKPVMILGSLGIALPPLGYLAMIDAGLNPAVWILRIIQGVGFGAHFSAFFTLAAQTAPEGRRSESVAMYGISGLGANLIGPLIGEWLVSTYGLSTFFITMTSIGLLAALLATRFATMPSHTAPIFNFQMLKTIINARKLFLPFGLAVLLAISFGTPIIFLAPLAELRAISGFSLYFTGYATTGIIIRLIGRKWADQFGWRRILIPTFGLYGAGLALVSLSNGVVPLIFAGLLMGSAHGLAFPAVTSLGYTFAPEQAKGTSMALVTGMMDLGVFFTGVLFGLIAEHSGYGIVFPLAVIAPLMAVSILIIHVLKNPEHLAEKTTGIPA